MGKYIVILLWTEKLKRYMNCLSLVKKQYQGENGRCKVGMKSTFYVFNMQVK